MFERQERTAILLLIGVTVVVLIAYAVLGILGNQPFARPYSGNQLTVNLFSLRELLIR